MFINDNCEYGIYKSITLYKSYMLTLSKLIHKFIISPIKSPRNSFEDMEKYTWLEDMYIDTLLVMDF